MLAVYEYMDLVHEALTNKDSKLVPLVRSRTNPNTLVPYTDKHTIPAVYVGTDDLDTITRLHSEHYVTLSLDGWVVYLKPKEAATKPQPVIIHPYRLLSNLDKVFIRNLSDSLPQDELKTIDAPIQMSYIESVLVDSPISSSTRMETATSYNLCSSGWAYPTRYLVKIGGYTRRVYVRYVGNNWKFYIEHNTHALYVYTSINNMQKFPYGGHALTRRRSKWA